MAYTTPTDLRNALAPLDGQAGGATAAEMTDPELVDAIAEAQSRVDAKLAEHYTVPFVDGSVPAIVVQLTRDIAAYFVTLTHRRSQPLADDHPVRLRYAEATAMLDALSGGDATIPGLSESASSAVAVQNVNGDEPFFTMSDFDLAAGPWAPPYPSPYG